MHLTLRIRPLRVLLAVAAVVVTAFLFRGQLLRLFMRPEPPPEQNWGISLDDTRPGEVTSIATGLDVRWAPHTRDPASLKCVSLPISAR